MANMKSEDLLSRLAEAEILKEAKRGAIRAEMVGPSGWKKPRITQTNKNFLKNTIRGAVISNRRQEDKSERGKQTKLDDFEREMKEKKRYKRRYLQASSKSSTKSLLRDSPKDLCSPGGSKELCYTKHVVWEDDGSQQLIPKCLKLTKEESDRLKLKTALPKKINFVSASSEAEELTPSIASTFINFVPEVKNNCSDSSPLLIDISEVATKKSKKKSKKKKKKYESIPPITSTFIDFVPSKKN